MTGAVDCETACTVATFLIHSNVDYCNSLLLSLPANQANRLQCTLNSPACAVTETPKLHHISTILKSLHWLKTHQRHQYKVYHKHTNHCTLVILLISFHSYTSITLSQCTHHISSHLLALPFNLGLRLQTGQSTILLLLYGTLFLLIFTRLILQSLSIFVSLC